MSCFQLAVWSIWQLACSCDHFMCSNHDTWATVRFNINISSININININILARRVFLVLFRKDVYDQAEVRRFYNIVEATWLLQETTTTAATKTTKNTTATTTTTTTATTTTTSKAMKLTIGVETPLELSELLLPDDSAELADGLRSIKAIVFVRAFPLLVGWLIGWLGCLLVGACVWLCSFGLAFYLLFIFIAKWNYFVFAFYLLFFYRQMELLFICFLFAFPDFKNIL